MINKVGARLQIVRQGSLETVARGQAVQDRKETNGREFVYFATKAIAGDIPNGNGDYFPWDHLLKSYTSFVGRNLFLNHNSSDPRNAIGKVLDAYPVVDDQTGEKYIECLAKIDKVAHPELARQIEAGILDSCSMGCSVESSQCNVCGTTIHSDQDNRCQHMSRGLGKEYRAELDFPEFNVKKGQAVKAHAINRGLNFTELSVVNVPAWDNAKIVQVIAQLKERVAKESTADVVNDLEEILKMASKNLQTEATADAVAETKESTAEAATPVLDTTPKETESRESRLTRIFKEKLSALDYLDLQAFMKKETEKISPVANAEDKKGEEKDVKDLTEAAKLVAETLAHEKEELADMEKEPIAVHLQKEAEKKCECTKDESCKMCKKEEAKKDDKKEASTEAKVEVTAEAVTPEAEAPAAEAVAATDAAPAAEATESVATEAKKNDGRKLKAIFVSKANAKESYWVVTDDGKPVLKATLSDIWGDNVEEVMDYAPSPLYGEALLQRLREDGVKKVALITNATIYTEAAGAGKGDLWPSQKSVGKDQYTPAAPGGHAKMKKLPEGVDMSGGDHGASAAGPNGGKGEQYPTSKSVGKSQYKPAGGGGPKVKTEKASAENADGKIEVTAEAEAPIAEVAKEAAPAMADVPAIPMDLPKEDAPKDDMPMLDAKPEGSAMKPIAEMSDEEKVAFMKELIESMDPSKKTAKPLAAVEKSVEKLDSAMTKEQEAAAKEAEKEAAAAAKEAEKAAKAAEKDAKKAEKDAPKEEAPKEDKKEEKKDDKKDEKPEKKDEAEAKDDKKEMPEGMKKEASEEPVVEATVELDLPIASDRERELEAQLAQLKLEQSLRAKTVKCQAIVSEMVEKDLLAADEADIQEEIANGKPLFDARASAFKKAIDKQCRDLLTMEENALTAFSMTVKRVKGRSTTSNGAVLKKAFKLHFDEHSNDDTWLDSAFNQMGSQKGKKLE